MLYWLMILLGLKQRNLVNPNVASPPATISLIKPRTPHQQIYPCPMTT